MAGMPAARHGRLPWFNADSLPFEKDQWELYNLEADFSQANDLAKQNPKKLRELQDAFVAEATKYNVFPLDDRFSERLDVRMRPSFFYGRKSMTFYPGMTRLPEGSAPKTCSATHTVTVKATIPEGKAEGVLVCIGGDSAGWSLCMEEGKVGLPLQLVRHRTVQGRISPATRSRQGRDPHGLRQPKAKNQAARLRSICLSTTRRSAAASCRNRWPTASVLSRWTSAWMQCHLSVRATSRNCLLNSTERSKV